MRALRHGAARPRRDARPDICCRHPAAAAAMHHGRGGGRMGPRRCRARRRHPRRAACRRHRPRFLRVPRPQQHPGRQAFRARQGQRHRHRRDQAQERRHLHPDRSAGIEAVSRADAHARLRPLHHGAGAGLGRLPRGAHPSRSRRALARLSDLPVECPRSGGDRRGGAVAAAAPDQSHVRPDPVARARHAHKKRRRTLVRRRCPLPREVVSCWRRWRRSAPCAG